MLTNSLRLSLGQAVKLAGQTIPAVAAAAGSAKPDETVREELTRKYRASTLRLLGLDVFFSDRLSVALRDKGTRHDLIGAVFALPGQDDLALIVRRVEALQEFQRLHTSR